MPKLHDFIRRLGPLEESICSKCCQIIRRTSATSTLQMAQNQHRCGDFSLNQVRRGEFAEINGLH